MRARKILLAAGAASLLSGLGRLIAGASLPLQSVAAITIISVGVGGIVAVANHGDTGAALKPLKLSGRIADEWRDVFDIDDEPTSFVRRLREGAEIYGTQYRMGPQIIDIAAVRADALQPCNQLTRTDGSSPEGWSRSLCPMRVSLVDRPGPARQIRTTACMPPQSAQADRTTALLDRDRRVIEIDTTIGGVVEAACHRTLHLPR